MRIRLANHQSDNRIPQRWLSGLARRALRHLKLEGPGWMSISFVDRTTMMRVNWQLLKHRGLTDVLSLKYDELGGVPASQGVVGEVIVSPTFAKQYASEHGLSYRDELARYVVHGLLHWAGYDDRTPSQRRRMRIMENRLLARCAQPS